MEYILNGRNTRRVTINRKNVSEAIKDMLRLGNVNICPENGKFDVYQVTEQGTERIFEVDMSIDSENFRFKKIKSAEK